MVRTKEEADRLFEAGNAEYEVARYQDALNSYDEAQKIYSEIQNWYGEARSLFYIGRVHEELFKVDKKNAALNDKNLDPDSDRIHACEKAIHAYEKAISILSDAQDKNDSDKLFLARVYNTLGVIFSEAFHSESKKGDFEKAEKYYKDACTALADVYSNKEPEVSLLLGKVLSNLGYLNEEYNQLLDALEWYKEALFYYREVNCSLEAVELESHLFCSIVQLTKNLLAKYQSRIYQPSNNRNFRHNEKIERETIDSIVTLAGKLLLRPSKQAGGGECGAPCNGTSR